MVPELRAKAGLSDDVDDRRALQRTCRCLFTVDSVLRTIDHEVDGRGWLWHPFAVAYPEDTAQLTNLLPEHNEVFGIAKRTIRNRRTEPTIILLPARRCRTRTMSKIACSPWRRRQAYSKRQLLLRERWQSGERVLVRRRYLDA
jgi:hypothetical protein